VSSAAENKADLSLWPFEVSLLVIQGCEDSAALSHRRRVRLQSVHLATILGSAPECRNPSPTNICTQELHVFPVVSYENKSADRIRDIVAMKNKFISRTFWLLLRGLSLAIDMLLHLSRNSRHDLPFIGIRDSCGYRTNRHTHLRHRS